MNNVLKTVENNLCISCGICEGVCPQKCIKMVKNKGMYHPNIDDGCVNCGICWDVCPGKGKVRDKEPVRLLTTKDLTGSYIESYNAWSKDEKIRYYGVSGGIVTTLIYRLLKIGEYDTAFVVDAYAYDKYVKTVRIDTNNADRLIDFGDERKLVPGSRYVPVGHGDGIKHIISNPTSKVIIVGTSCAIRGYMNVIERYGLNRDNYLLIGLFCDSVLNYNIWDYFINNKMTHGRKVDYIHLRSKERGGWLGKDKVVFSDGTCVFLERKSRIEVREYYRPERCLYCIDKLNCFADISVGDDYTDSNHTEMGSNSVVIRSKRGMNNWNKCEEYVELRNIEYEQIAKSQIVQLRAKNQCFADRKERLVYEKSRIDLDINGNGCKADRETDWREYRKAVYKTEISSWGIFFVKSRLLFTRGRRLMTTIRKRLIPKSEVTK